MHPRLFHLRVPTGEGGGATECEVRAVGEISDCRTEGPGLNTRHDRGLSFG